MSYFCKKALLTATAVVTNYGSSEQKLKSNNLKVSPYSICDLFGVTHESEIVELTK